MGLFDKIKNMFRQPQQTYLEETTEQNQVPLEQKEEPERKEERNLVPLEERNMMEYTFDKHYELFLERRELIRNYYSGIEKPMEESFTFEEADGERFQELLKKAYAWKKDMEAGWYRDDLGNLKGLGQHDARLIAQYEAENNIPQDERIINYDGKWEDTDYYESIINNIFSLRENVTREEYLSVREKAKTYYNKLWDLQEAILKDIRSTQFNDTYSLMENIEQFSKLEGKHCTLRELAELRRSNPDFGGNIKKQECFQAIVKECQEQELEKIEVFKKSPHFLKQEMMEEMALLPNA